MTNFICEIDKMACGNRAESYPLACAEHAKKVEECIRGDGVPSEIRYAFFKITSTCNSDCAYCEHAFSRSGGKSEIPLPDLLNIIDQLGGMGVTACSLSGGEPLIYGHIDEAVRRMKANRIEPVLLTNGILLPQKMQQLYDCGLRYVIMSLDSFEAAHYKKTRGIDFESVMRAYRYMVQFKDCHKDLVFRITTVISEENIDDIVRLCDITQGDGVGVQFTPYHNFINKEADYGVQDIDKIAGLAAKLTDYKKQGRLICNSEEYIAYIPKFFERKKRVPEGYRCKCGYDAVYIWNNMDVRSCWSTSLPAMGNLKERTLAGIWSGAEYKRQRGKMLSCECEGCWLLCTAEFTLLHEEYLRQEGKQ